MNDRCAANHAAIQLVNDSWDKTLNELNCHLHPLESRAALRDCERGAQGQGCGNDCYASKITVQMNKLRFKDDKGDPQGFKTFLDNEKLLCGLLPHYRGNRLHILFHICGVFVQHFSFFKKYLEQGTDCGGLRASLFADVLSTQEQVEMQVLRLLGKFLPLDDAD